MAIYVGIKCIKTIAIRMIIWWTIILLHSVIFYYWLRNLIEDIHNDMAFMYSHKTVLMIYIEIGSFFLASIAGFTCVYVPYVFYRINTKARDQNLNSQLQHRRRSLELIRQEIEKINHVITDLEEGVPMSYKDLISLDAFLSDEVAEMEQALEIQSSLDTPRGKIRYVFLLISASCCFFTLTCTIVRRALYSIINARHVRSALSIFGKAQIYIVVFVVIVNAREFFIFTDRVLVFLSVYVDHSFQFIKHIFSQATIPLAAASFMNIAIPSYIIVLFPWLVVGDESFQLFEKFYSLLKPIYDTGFLITAFFTILFTTIFRGLMRAET